MEHEREEESGEMFSPNRSEEYTPHSDVPSFTVQGLRDALTEAESTVTGPPCPMDEFIIQLEVTIVDRPGRLCPPAFSWNGGMVQHVLKGDPALRDLEHVPGGWPRAHVSILLWPAWISQSLQGIGPLCPFTHSRYLCQVDWEICTLQCIPSTVGGRMTTCDSHAGKVQAMHLAPRATCFTCTCKWIYWFWIVTTGGWSTPSSRGPGGSGGIGDA